VNRVAAVVVVHGSTPELPDCLAAVAPQVGRVVVVENIPTELPQLPPDTVVLRAPRPRGFAANVNAAIAATDEPFVLLVNPDAVAGPGVVDRLLQLADAHPRAGVVAPLLRYPDGSLQLSRRRFPTVAGTLWRRTPLRLLRPPLEHQRGGHYLDDVPAGPVRCDWMLGACMLLRRQMLTEIGGFDERFRLYGEDIDLCYRAHKAGWERWFVPDAVVMHRYEAVIDKTLLTRRTWWHLRGMLRFLRKHPERLRALR
jgi:N-acetylglucosaminyl-diphospho-decaprenol L-rhamnosyltransferase